MAKRIRWLEHARQNLIERDIKEGDVLRTVSEPEQNIPSSHNRRILMRFYHDDILQQRMLLRVVIEETVGEIIIITLYKTSRSERYFKGTK